MSKRRIAIFGSTGSIGRQTLEVIEANPSLFSVEILTAQNNVQLLVNQALRYGPKIVVIGNEEKYQEVLQALSGTGISVASGEQALEDTAGLDIYDTMIAAIVGFAGLRPTLKAIENGKTIGLANKETLVVAGDIVMKKAKEHHVHLVPVDSEHSAIFQCMQGEDYKKIDRIILTASGGPFLGRKPNFLVNVKREHALQHPNWSMGAKISVDSATLMNKGLEMIEAKWLFDVTLQQIKVVIHPQSIIHSMVEFEDGSMKAQMGMPDMRVPIQYALTYPARTRSNFPRYNFKDPAQLTFDEPDIKTFRNLFLAQKALETGGNMPCILNAANEIAVYAFLKNRIGFLEMTELIEQAMEKIPFIQNPTLNDYFESDAEARTFAASLVEI